jgi:hypothetical protein
MRLYLWKVLPIKKIQLNKAVIPLKHKKLWEELLYFQQFFVAIEVFLPSLCLAMKGGIDVS